MANESGHAPQGHKITIKIDKESVHTSEDQLTGSGIRQLVSPPISPERDLWLVNPGPADDDRISDDQAVPLKNGMHFFTAPTTINPGLYAHQG